MNKQMILIGTIVSVTACTLGTALVIAKHLSNKGKLNSDPCTPNVNTLRARTSNVEGLKKTIRHLHQEVQDSIEANKTLLKSITRKDNLINRKDNLINKLLNRN